MDSQELKELMNRCDHCDASPTTGAILEGSIARVTRLCEPCLARMRPEPEERHEAMSQLARCNQEVTSTI